MSRFLALLCGLGVCGVLTVSCGRPLGSLFDNDGPAPTTCGDGVLDPGEQCDGPDLQSMACHHWGFDDGLLACTPECRVDTSGCWLYGPCGNGHQEPGEACDTLDMGGDTCSSLGFAGGTLACTALCLHDTSGCFAGALCGDGRLDPGEACDDGNQESCDGCSASCQPEVCGDGRAECSEACDGDDLGGVTCGSLDYPDGDLRCTTSCELDTSDCGSAALTELYEDFEDPDLVAARWTFTGDWESGHPTGAHDEPSAYEGARCMGTRIGDLYSSSQTYAGNMAISPWINLASANFPRLIFQRWLAVETCCDGLTVMIKPGPGHPWTALSDPSVPYTTAISNQASWSGSGPALTEWTEIEFDLAGYRSHPIRIAFAVATDSSVIFPGAYIDNVYIGALSNVP